MHELNERGGWIEPQGPRLPPEIRLRRFDEHANATGVKELACKLCIEAGEDPNAPRNDVGPPWEDYVYKAREALGYVDEVKYRHYMMG